ncbi:apolipoprotein L6-like isoform X2 [Fukomys damarensis]|uniref:apolipoprotein L6-like isoform X2 n=1 Tax=Fukomys damarensis TaxID=885580 RepID=UPI0014559FA3|nr:apolipoprotein L6-like isoform X2 [Fukomys damarensis]
MRFPRIGSRRSDSLASHPGHLAMETSRDAPLNAATTETSPVRQDGLSSCPSSSQPENHVVPGDMDLKLKRQPYSQAGEADDMLLGADLGLQDAGYLSAEETRFLEEFPRWKQEREVVITKLRALADDTHTTHKTFTKAGVVANSITVVSGVLSMLGLALTPVTAGGSLIFTVAGQGVGLTASVISIVADLLENSHTENTRALSSPLAPSSDRACQEDTGGQTARYARASGELVYKCGSTFQVIRNHARALRLAKAHPHLVPAARHLRTVGHVSGSVGRQVKKAFKDTALIMSRKALLKSGAAAVLSLSLDVFGLWEKLKALEDKEGTELADQLRDQALELEEELSQRMELYEMLWQKKLLREERLRGHP